LFRVRELPFLSKAEYSGSRLLSSRQIEKLLEEKKLAPPLGKPADPVVLHRIASAIRSALNELGHPQADVQIRQSETPHATVSVQFVINDGPLLPVRQVTFIGNPRLPSKVLSAQMRSITPQAFFASLRGKDAYTPQAFEEDSQRILSYYQNHGYPEARIGLPLINKVSSTSHRWIPWPHEATRNGLSLVVPVGAGPYYEFASIGASQALRQAAGGRGAKLEKFSEAEKGKPYSAKEMESVRRLWLALIRPNNSKTDSPPNRGASRSISAIRLTTPCSASNSPACINSATATFAGASFCGRAVPSTITRWKRVSRVWHAQAISNQFAKKTFTCRWTS
jgi:outer membrane protein assembly factor BamA